MSGADAALFDIDADGKVTFKAAPDFEAPVDEDGNNVYDITVNASDGVHSTTKNVAITVTNENDNDPVFTSGTSANFAENGTGTVYDANATDADNLGTLTYSLSGDDAALFDIDLTGKVTFKAAPDSKPRRMRTATMSTTSSSPPPMARIRPPGCHDTVTDQNEIPPEITSGDTATFAENDTGTAYDTSATDADTDVDELTYTLSGDDAALFNIDADGKVTFKAAPDSKTRRTRTATMSTTSPLPPPTA